MNFVLVLEIETIDDIETKGIYISLQNWDTTRFNLYFSNYIYISMPMK